MAASSPIADPRERRLWLREAIRPARNAGAERVLRAPFRPARGHGESYVWRCRRIAGALVWPEALCLAHIAASGAMLARGEMAALDFLTIYGFGAWLRGLAGLVDPRAASQALGGEAAVAVTAGPRPT